MAKRTPTPCQENDPELWFSDDENDVAYAKSLCQRCPERAALACYGAGIHEDYGVWAGIDRSLIRITPKRSTA